MELLIGGDLVPTKSNYDLFNNNNITELLGEELYNICNGVDIRIFNLETPLTDKETPIKKCGSNLRAPISTIKGIKGINPTLLTLANNHILDQGEEGLMSTINILKKNNIPYVGVGNNIDQACKSYVLKYGKHTVGVYACAENEFTIATAEKAGANPFDPLESLDHIVELRKICDFLIVLFHGGKEHYRYPSPYLQKVCRKIVDKGADLIICQHSHCIGTYEDYKDRKIIYGQGNFIFDDEDNEYWNTSILIKVNLTETFTIDYIPICKTNNKVRLATENEKKIILNEFNERSKNILSDKFIQKEYENFSKKNIKMYLNTFSGSSRIVRKLNDITKNKIYKNKYNEKRLLAFQNFIMCESHRELLLTALKEIRKEKCEKVRK